VFLPEFDADALDNALSSGERRFVEDLIDAIIRDWKIEHSRRGKRRRRQG
jgi:hypothetical protein